MSPETPPTAFCKESDVFYITTEPGVWGVCEESLSGVCWKHALDDDRIVGVTILDFESYWKPRHDELVAELDFHLHIGLENAKALLEGRITDYSIFSNVTVRSRDDRPSSLPSDYSC